MHVEVLLVSSSEQSKQGIHAYYTIRTYSIWLLMDQSITDLHYLATAADDDVAAGLEQSSTVRTGTRQQQ